MKKLLSIVIGLLLVLGVGYAFIPNSALSIMGCYLGLELATYIFGHRLAGWAWTLRPIIGLAAIAILGIKHPAAAAHYWDCAVALTVIYIPTLIMLALGLDWFNELWDWYINQKGVRTKPNLHDRD